jgi:dTDP-glucose 4,6-dehydratase
VTDNVRFEPPYKILITGGCGFLGSHLVEHFLKNTDYDIVVLDRLTYASSGFDRLRDVQWLPSGAISPISALSTSRVRVFTCDLSQPVPEGVKREIGEVDYIIHAAAESHVDRSITDPVPFISANVFGTHWMLWYARELADSGCLKRVFCVSTDEVYGPAAWDHPGHDEESAFRPANPYAAAKAGGEAIAMAYANTYRLPITIVNTMNLIGERQTGEKFVPTVIRKVLNGETVHIHADATRTRSGTRFYLHCRNYASALEYLMGVDLGGHIMRHGGYPRDVGQLPLKVHVAGEREVSNLELAQEIADIIGKPLRYELVDFHSSRPGHDLRYALNADLIHQMGWKQPLNLDESLEKTVRWFLRDENRRWLDFGVQGG